ncbi:MAG: hypothetical protein AB2L11_09545 [Syntrophobacteraceae bacterium]
MKWNKILIPVLVFAFVLSFVACVSIKSATAADAVEEETVAGMVVKGDKGLVIEADDGDYLVKGNKAQELSKMVGKLVEVTGVITESDKGDSIEVKSFEEIQE